MHQEVPVTLQGETYPVDLVWVSEKLNLVVAYEVKRVLSGYLLDQCHRILGHADEVWAAVLEPLTQSSQHQRYRGMLETIGVGLVYVAPDGCEIVLEPLHARFRSIELWPASLSHRGWVSVSWRP